MSKEDLGGSVLVEKVNEHLDVAIKEYNSRITAQTKLMKKRHEFKPRRFCLALVSPLNTKFKAMR